MKKKPLSTTSLCMLQITIDLDIEYSLNDSSGNNIYRNRTLSVFSSRPESPTDSTDERQMLLDVEQNIANLEKTFTDNRRLAGGDWQEDGGGGGGGSSDSAGCAVTAGTGRTHKKGLFNRFNSEKDTGNERKR